MKSIYISCFVILSVLFSSGCNTSTAPGSTPELSRLSKVEGAKKIDFINATEGWVLCNNNKIYKTVDGGKIWKAVNINTQETITNLQFVDGYNGWISTYNSIIKTTDGGITWLQILENKSSHAFIAMNLVSKDFGWVSGTNDAKVYCTKNGGETWELVNLNAVGKICNIQFTGDNSGWAAEALGRIYRTGDKGTTWEETEKVKFANCIYALDEQTCYVGNCIYASSLANQKASVYRTIDGGKTWIDLELPKSEMVGKMVFTSKARGCVLADIGNFETIAGNSITGSMKLIYTDDAGKNWVNINTENISIKDICKAGNRIIVLLWDDTLLELQN